jgi:hypothetical protein
LWEIATTTDAQAPYAYKPDSRSTLIRFTPGIEAWYTNEALHFSFRIPEGFSAPDGTVNAGTGHIVELSNTKSDKLLILALPIDTGADQVLTEQIVRDNAPGQNLSDFHEGLLQEGTRGLMFRTDSGEWGGGGIAFWFIHDTYLYELSTYTRDAELLDAVMQTWRFGLPVPPSPSVKESGKEAL